MKQFVNGFLFASVLFIAAACTPTDFLRGGSSESTPAEQTVSLSRPDATAYEGVDGGICFQRADATNLFLYINELEMNQ